MGRESIRLQGIFPALTTCFDHEGNLYKTKIFHNISKLNQIALSGYVVVRIHGRDAVTDCGRTHSGYGMGA